MFVVFVVLSRSFVVSAKLESIKETNSEDEKALELALEGKTLFVD